MKVFLPSNFNRETMYDFIDQVLDEDAKPISVKFDFDFTKLKFIRPVGITILGNLVDRLLKHGSRVTFTYRKPNRKLKNCPICFLDDSKFFERYLGSTLDEKASLRPTTRQLKSVTINNSYDYLDSTVKWLARKIGVTAESLGEIKSCLMEIFNNINDHSFENVGNVFIQQYPNENQVMIAISDFGIGIPQSMQQKFPSLDDAEALQMAVKEGVTTKSTPKNRGAGLDFLLQNVVNNNKGSVFIHSNHGILNSTYGKNGMITKTNKTEGFYPGTLLEIVFQTDTIENIEEEFTWE